MKKKILTVCICLAIALTALCACNIGGSSALTKPNDVYGMGAISTVRLLGANTSAKAIARLSSARSVTMVNKTENGADSEVKAQAQKFNEYFTALDSFMSEDIVTTVTETNTDTQYPYETKLTINSKDFNGKAVQHVMYFTETLAETKTDDDETESKYTLTGVMVMDGVDCFMTGERSVEQEEGETENELKIRAYADPSDKTNYVEMAQEHSVENNETETEYVYSIVVNGVVVEQTAVEFETEKEGSKEEVEYSLEFRNGDVKGKYVVERETVNGKAQIKVEYNVDGKQGEFKITEITNENGEKRYEYSFEDNTKLVF